MRSQRVPLEARVNVKHLSDISPHIFEDGAVEVRHLKRVEDIELKFFDIRPGKASPFHTHPHAHEGVVVSGTGELRLEGGDEPLAPGDVFSIYPNQPHAIVCGDDGPLRFVCMDCFLD